MLSRFWFKVTNWRYFNWIFERSFTSTKFLEWNLDGRFKPLVKEEYESLSRRIKSISTFWTIWITRISMQGKNWQNFETIVATCRKTSMETFMEKNQLCRYRESWNWLLRWVKIDSTFSNITITIFMQEPKKHKNFIQQCSTTLKFWIHISVEKINPKVTGKMILNMDLNQNKKPLFFGTFELSRFWRKSQNRLCSNRTVQQFNFSFAT